MKRFILAIGAFFASHKGWAATFLGSVPGVTAVTIGSDPWPWVIGATGGAFLYLKREPTTRRDALGNTLLSLILGGIAAPTLALLVETRYPEWFVPHCDYFIAIPLGWGWPWLIEKGWPQLLAWWPWGQKNA